MRQLGLWIGWVLASAAGSIFGIGLSYGVAGKLVGGSSGDLPGIVLRDFLLFAIAGCIAGLFQWLVVKGYIPQAGWWVLACAVGWATGFALANRLTGVWSFSVAGGVIGFMQWLVLRRTLPGAGWWLLASCIGWSLGWMFIWDASQVVYTIIPLAESFGFALGFAIVGLVSGAITGVLLTRLTR